MAESSQVQVRFYQPPEPLRRYFTTFYMTEIEAGPDGLVTDYLHPEWANLRVFGGALPETRLLGGPPVRELRAIVTGPTTSSVKFTIGSARVWGIGLLPLGWAKFVGAPAARFADRLCDPNYEPGLAVFKPLIETLFARHPDEPGELARIVSFFERRGQDEAPDAARIMAVHLALIDPAVSTVTEMAEATGLPGYTVEAIVQAAFRVSAKPPAASPALHAQPVAIHARSGADLERGDR